MKRTTQNIEKEIKNMKINIKDIEKVLIIKTRDRKDTYGILVEMADSSRETIIKKGRNGQYRPLKEKEIPASIKNFLDCRAGTAQPTSNVDLVLVTYEKKWGLM